MTKFCGRIRLIRSVLGASEFSVLKLTEIVILWGGGGGVTPSFLASAYIDTFGAYISSFFLLCRA